MTPRKSNQSPSKKAPTIKVPVKEQVSAGGVVFRGDKGKIEVVIISVGGQNRWQLPKGMVEKGESPETAAVREAREEAGVSSEVVQLIETIEYWYAGLDNGIRVRFHKRVHFYLLRYLSGDTVHGFSHRDVLIDLVVAQPPELDAHFLDRRAEFPAA